MPLSSKPSLAALGLAVALAFSGASAAPLAAADLRLLAQARAGLGEDQAAAIARERTGGRVLAVKRKEGGGRPLYEVKVLLADGRITVLRVDAESGAPR